MRAAHLTYVRDIVGATQPRFVNHATEVNMYYSVCGAARWAPLLEFANDVYDAAKAAAPSALVFPSFQAGFLRGQSATDSPCHGKPAGPCIDKNLMAAAGLKRDLFAFSAYTQMDGVTGLPDAKPRADFSGYLEEIVARVPADEGLAVAETGFLTTTLAVRDFPSAGAQPSCFPLLAATEESALAWLQYLLSLSDSGPSAGRWRLLTWWSDSDFLPKDVEAACYTEPCADCRPLFGRNFTYCSMIDAFRAAYSPPWSGEALWKEFGTMGIRTHDSLELKPRLGTLWRSRCASCASQATSAQAAANPPVPLTLVSDFSSY